MNTHPLTEYTEATTDEDPAGTRTEVITDDRGEGKEATVPAPPLVMITADDADACTGDGCAVTLRKG